MRVSTRSPLLVVFTLVLTAGLGAPAAAEVVLTPENIEWHNNGDNVAFHLRFYNDDPMQASPPGSGDAHSQEYGAFMPDYGLISVFDIPPIEPESFFDVFFEVPRSMLPASAAEIVPGGPLSPGKLPRSPGELCPPDDHWDGNIDVFWNVPGFPQGQVTFHPGTIQAQPGGGCSLIHVVTGCALNAGWMFIGGCPGFTFSLVNEDLITPASNPVPPFWSGWIKVCIAANVPVNTSCCVTLRFNCPGSGNADVNLCATACDLGGVPVEPTTWGRVKALYR